MLLFLSSLNVPFKETTLCGKLVPCSLTSQIPDQSDLVDGRCGLTSRGYHCSKEICGRNLWEKSLQKYIIIYDVWVNFAKLVSLCTTNLMITLLRSLLVNREDPTLDSCESYHLCWPYIRGWTTRNNADILETSWNLITLDPRFWRIIHGIVNW